MKNYLLMTLMSGALFGGRVSAETLVLGLEPNGAETNRISIATNEAVVIDYLDAPSGFVIYHGSGVSNTVRIFRGSAIAGPCQATFVSDNGVVTFHRILSPAIKTVILGANETNTVTVASNQLLRVFAAETAPNGNVAVTQGAITRTLAPGESFLKGAEFSGPLTLTIGGFSKPANDMPHNVPDYRQLFSYYLSDDFLQVTANGYLESPPGTFEVLVEKSNDLANWSPAMVQATASAETRAFYRLRIQK